MKKAKRLCFTFLLSLSLFMTACSSGNSTEESTQVQGEIQQIDSSAQESQISSDAESSTNVADIQKPENEVSTDKQETTVEKNGDIMILFTSDVHCGIDQGFGYVGLQQIREQFEAKGYETILVDDGDSIQGGPIGTLSKGESIIKLMNDMHYDVAIPGNHEFDYGMDRFLELTKKADFPYISCNFNKEGKLVFDPYVILEAAGKKIAFVGVTTPKTLNTSTPKYFQNENGEFVYGFLQDETGESVYQAVQKAVDDARAEGADFVYVMGHIGSEYESKPWTYEEIISNTTGIDVFLDGHTHDTEQVTMKNKEGKSVVRSAAGTKLNCIGYSHISAEGKITETNIWSWPNEDSAAELFNIQNEISGIVKETVSTFQDSLNKVVANTEVALTIYDPVAVDGSGNPIRIVRRTETNLGDLCADAFLYASGADVAIINGGGIRKNISQGDITYGNILNVFPYGNQLCVIEVTGQQILDALEWGARAVPDENGGFLQVAGMSYEIDSTIPNGCISDENAMYSGIKGKRRVRNVMVGEVPLDAKKTYTLASINYILLDHGDGYTMFDGAKLLQDCVQLDNQLLIDYILEAQNGVISSDKYGDPYGQGRITVLE